MVDRCLDALARRLLPPRCLLCGATGQVPGLDLCDACAGDLPRDPVPLRAGPWPVGRCFAPYGYAFPADHLVHRLKYHGRLAAGRVLGVLLAGAVRRSSLQLEVDCLVPVPLHPSRHAERGFNQSAEIAERAALELGRGFEPCAIRRVRATRPQVGLSPPERRANLRGAFLAAGVHGLRIALVDDVLTTGATAASAAEAALDAGAASVDLWCIARAPAPERVDWSSATQSSPA